MTRKLTLACALAFFVNLILPMMAYSGGTPPSSSGGSPTPPPPSGSCGGAPSCSPPPPTLPACSDSSCMPSSIPQYENWGGQSWDQCNLPALLKQRHEERLKVLNKNICVTKKEKEKFELLNDESCGDLELSKQACDAHKKTLSDELTEREIERGKLITVLCRPEPMDDSCDDYFDQD